MRRRFSRSPTLTSRSAPASSSARCRRAHTRRSRAGMANTRVHSLPTLTQGPGSRLSAASSYRHSTKWTTSSSLSSTTSPCQATRRPRRQSTSRLQAPSLALPRSASRGPCTTTFRYRHGRRSRAPPRSRRHTSLSRYMPTGARRQCPKARRRKKRGVGRRVRRQNDAKLTQPERKCLQLGAREHRGRRRRRRTEEWSQT